MSSLASNLCYLQDYCLQATGLFDLSDVHWTFEDLYSKLYSRKDERLVKVTKFYFKSMWLVFKITCGFLKVVFVALDIIIKYHSKNCQFQIISINKIFIKDYFNNGLFIRSFTRSFGVTSPQSIAITQKIEAKIIAWGLNWILSTSSIIESTIWVNSMYRL